MLARPSSGRGFWSGEAGRVPSAERSHAGVQCETRGRTVMNYWILKTEPSSYSYDQLERDKKTVWDGVRNNLALKHLKAMRKGDRALIYHTGKEKAAVGLADVVSVPYTDPADPALVVVDISASGRLPRPVTLKEIKAERAFADMPLVRMSRLSVGPATATH